MRFYKGLSALALLLMAACVPYEGMETAQGVLPEAQISDTVREAVAPGQDLSAVRISPMDGCYEYRHVGPVETTFIPLRTKDGRRICTPSSSG